MGNGYILGWNKIEYLYENEIVSFSMYLFFFKLD